MPKDRDDQPADGSSAASASQAADGGHDEEANRTAEQRPTWADEARQPLDAETLGTAPVSECQSSPTADSVDTHGDAAAHLQQANGSTGPPADAASADDPGPPRQTELPPAALLNGATHVAAPESPQRGAGLPPPSPARAPAPSGLSSAPAPGSHSPAVAAALGVITGQPNRELRSCPDCACQCMVA